MVSDITIHYQPTNIIPKQSGNITIEEINNTISEQRQPISPNQEKTADTNKLNTNTSPPEDTDPGSGFLTIGIGVYWDSNLTSKVNTTDWGFLQPGTQKNYTVYVYNEGNSPVTLSLFTSNWVPATAPDYFVLTWDYNGQTLNAGTQMQITLTLTVSSNITGISDFSFDITMVASS